MKRNKGKGEDISSKDESEDVPARSPGVSDGVTSSTSTELVPMQKDRPQDMDLGESSVSNVPSASQERKALRKYQAMYDQASSSSSEEESSDEEGEYDETEEDWGHQEGETAEGQGNVILKFRNHRPRDAALQKYVLPTPDSEPIIAELATRFEKHMEFNLSEQDVLSLAPKKSTWDLKRDVEQKLNKLEKRTQRAMLQILQKEQEERKRALKNKRAAAAVAAAKKSNAVKN